MHGLINRSIQCFLRDTYGAQAWKEVAQYACVDTNGFEAMLDYPDKDTDKLIGATARHLNKSEDAVLEDLGTYLVTHPSTTAVRRLLRFGGETFWELLHSLDDLPDRAWLAVPELQFPRLELRDHGPGEYTLHLTEADPRFAFVLMGILRALADDYGALVLLDHAGEKGASAILSIRLADLGFAEGNAFSLSQTSV